MARVIIREQDITGNVIDQDFTDIAFVPGFVKYPKEEYSSPQLCIGEAQFIDMFGNEPALAFSKFSYNVMHKVGEIESPVLNPKTGNEIFYLDSNDVESLSDVAYHYARELIYRGLPLYYCPVNKKIYETTPDGKKVWTGKLEAYDGNQNFENRDPIEAIVEIPEKEKLPGSLDLNELDGKNTFYTDAFKSIDISFTQEEEEGKTITYAWFVNGVLNEEETSDTINTELNGTTEVFCIATFTDDETGVTSRIESDTVTIYVVSKEANLTILPKGSEEELLISTQPGTEKFSLVKDEDPKATYTSGVQKQIVSYNMPVVYTVQVKGVNVEKFSYLWYAEGTTTEGEEVKKQLISKNQICRFSSSMLKPGDYKISVIVIASPASSLTLDPIVVVEGAEDLSTTKIIDIARARAIDTAMNMINSEFAQEILTFFINTDNTELIKDRGLYNFKYMTTGGYPLFEAAIVDNKSDGTTMPLAGWQKALANLLAVCGQKTVDDSKDYIAEDGSTQRQGRGDCVLLIDHAYDKAQDTMVLYDRVREYFEDPANVAPETLEFAALFTPWGNYNMTYTSHNVNVNLPASFAYLGCLADSIQAYDNWHAIAGVTRGTVKNLNEILLTNPLTNTKANKCQTDPETAEAGRVSINCITEIKPYGQVIWGNRTLQRADNYKHVTAMGFLNLRNEVSDIKKLVYRAARRWMFEQNTSILWINFKSTITPLLERMVHGYGLTRYEIRRGEKTKKHKLYAEIRIWPIYAVEYIDVTIQILDEETIVTEE